MYIICIVFNKKVKFTSRKEKGIMNYMQQKKIEEHEQKMGSRNRSKR